MIYKYTAICLMALILLFVIHLFIIRLNFASGSETPQFVESNLIQGLYSSSDKVVILTTDNFDQHVYNSSSSWLVQFYNSWCGHCIKFSPVWKKFAADIHNWQSIVKVGVINCAVDENTQHCRDYDIMGYPTIRFFQHSTSNLTIGQDFIPPSRDDAEKVRQGFLEFLGSVSPDIPVKNWPILSPIHRQDIDLITIDNQTQEFLLIVEEDSSYIGRDLIMDLNGLSWLTVRRISRDNYPTNESFQLFSMVKPEQVIPVNAAERTRFSVFKAVRDYFRSKGHPVDELSLEGQVADGEKRTSSVQTLEQKKLVHSVFQADLDTALAFSLSHEIPLKADIKGDAFTALINYLSMIKKYFPFHSTKQTFVENVIHELNSRTNVSGEQFKKLIDRHGKEFLNQPREYIGCAGSQNKYRGYTCGMWMMFHTMTVKRYTKEVLPPAKEVLSTITEYIRNFFGCKECADHFVEMSKTINENVTVVPDDLIWLWKAHNTVNNRLAGDTSEDPAFPKQQFPHREMCSTCRTQDGLWNEAEVLRFLIDMYSHIKPRNTSIASKADRITIDSREEDEGWNFGLTDVNACIGLYMLFACMLTVYTVRLFIKRSPRSHKHYKYDFSSKA